MKTSYAILIRLRRVVIRLTGVVVLLLIGIGIGNEGTLGPPFHLLLVKEVVRLEAKRLALHEGDVEGLEDQLPVAQQRLVGFRVPETSPVNKDAIAAILGGGGGVGLVPLGRDNGGTDISC